MASGGDRRTGDGAYGVSMLAKAGGGVSSVVAEAGAGNAAATDRVAMRGPFFSPARDLVMRMRFDAAQGVVDLEDNLVALRDAALAAGYPFNRHMLRNELQAATFLIDCHADVDVTLSPAGHSAIVTLPLAQ